MDKETLSFIKAVGDAKTVLRFGEEILTRCPCCGDFIQVKKSLYNGHVSAICLGCRRNLIE